MLLIFACFAVKKNTWRTSVGLIQMFGILQEALTSLSMDPGLHQMLPRFTMFVSEGVS